jgi:hypothetical protein
MVSIQNLDTRYGRLSFPALRKPVPKRLAMILEQVRRMQGTADPPFP